MTDPNHPPSDHLAGITAGPVCTGRLKTNLLTCGMSGGEPVLFLHGNLSAATFWEETMLALPSAYFAAAPDQRGYGQSDPEARIDATRGVTDWVDDALSLADHLGWNRFHLVAHSLGGCVAWGLLAVAASRLRSVTLVSPGPPCGFGGARGDRGELNHADGAGSGAALVHPRLVACLAAGERGLSDPLFSPRAVMNRLYWNPPLRPAREEQLLTALLQVHLGDDRFPGDWTTSPHWPGFAPGQFGPVNAISPRYNQWVLPRLLESPDRPPLLWIYGLDDPIVCDGSASDAGMQGQLGLRPDWPGAATFPPQPLRTQVEYVLNAYQHAGGKVRRLGLNGVGHTAYLERPAEFQRALCEHLTD